MIDIFPDARCVNVNGNRCVKKGHLFIAKLPRKLPDVDGGHPPRFEQVDSCQNQRQNTSNDQPKRHNRSLALLLLFGVSSNARSPVWSRSGDCQAMCSSYDYAWPACSITQKSGRGRFKDGAWSKGRRLHISHATIWHRRR